MTNECATQSSLLLLNMNRLSTIGDASLAAGTFWGPTLERVLSSAGPRTSDSKMPILL